MLEAKKHAGKMAAYETVLDAILQPDGRKQSVKERKQEKKKQHLKALLFQDLSVPLLCFFCLFWSPINFSRR